MSSAKLVRRSVHDWSNVDAATFLIEEDVAFDDGEDRVILAHADVAAWTPLGAALANDDVAGDDELAAVLLDAATLWIGVTTVTGRALTFLMCHRTCPH